MKRKKWTEKEESTLISTYAELQRSGALSKLKKREKKFEPIAQRLNAVHHMSNPISFPFRWTWHDVSVKVQNMRHQFLNVKQKIRILSPNSDSTSFNWAEGQNHWHNFLKYKDVFGDLDLDPDPALPLPLPLPPPPTSNDAHHSNGGDGDDDDDGEREDDKDQASASASASASALLVVDDEEAAAVFGYDGFVDGDGPDVLGMGLGLDCEDGFEADRDEEELEPAVSDGEERDGGEDGENGGLGFVREVKRAKKRGEDWGSGRVLELREMMVRREERRREREFRREEEVAVREDRRREKEREKEEQMTSREFELWERERMWVRRESERRMRVEVELEAEKRRRMKLEEKREEEEMEWRERMVGMQLEHEKKMMEMHAEACHNQTQVLGVLMRLVGQFFGPGGDGLGAAIGGGLPLQNLQQHPGSLVGENGKADGSSGAHFM
ncbi:hypothetical protein ACLOJK_011945 [Asimina triloba]